MVGLTPRHTYNASLGLVLRALAHMRAGGALLHAAEWRMYQAALHSNCICARMAVVAAVAGDSQEVTPLSGTGSPSLLPHHFVADLIPNVSGCGAKCDSSETPFGDCGVVHKTKLVWVLLIKKPDPCLIESECVQPENVAFCLEKVLFHIIKR